MFKVYYAHPMYLYNTKQEGRDIVLLENLGFEVVNPNSEPYISEYQKCIDNGHHDMNYWVDLSNTCDLIAFRAYPDGTIGSGVGAEILRNPLIPVIELPRMLKQRVVDLEATRQFLSEIGQR